MNRTPRRSTAARARAVPAPYTPRTTRTAAQAPNSASSPPSSSQGRGSKGLFQHGRWYCDCIPRQPAVRRETRKPGPNQGRWFFTCLQRRCTFFVWDNMSGSGATPSTYKTSIGRRTTPEAERTDGPAAASLPTPQRRTARAKTQRPATRTTRATCTTQPNRQRIFTTPLGRPALPESDDDGDDDEAPPTPTPRPRNRSITQFFPVAEPSAAAPPPQPLFEPPTAPPPPPDSRSRSPSYGDDDFDSDMERGFLALAKHCEQKSQQPEPKSLAGEMRGAAQPAPEPVPALLSAGPSFATTATTTATTSFDTNTSFATTTTNSMQETALTPPPTTGEKRRWEDDDGDGKKENNQDRPTTPVKRVRFNGEPMTPPQSSRKGNAQGQAEDKAEDDHVVTATVMHLLADQPVAEAVRQQVRVVLNAALAR